MNSLKKEIFNIKNSEQFNSVCINVFKFQYSNNLIYKRYVDELKVDISKINSYKQIPFLPIEFFKSHKIISGNKKILQIFKSSGTTGINTSTHYVCDTSLYMKSFIKTFTGFYGSPKNYTILALLPSYLEREDSSLVFMIKELMNISNKPDNGFYLKNYEELHTKIRTLEKNKQKTIIFGVSFALLDLFNAYEIELNHTTIIETGGMKGRKKEMTREELHYILKEAANLNNIHSEYGMTELLSQAYSSGNYRYLTPPWMKIIIRDTNDPFDYIKTGMTGGINIIDLANIYSCSFIETKDLGKIYPDNSFEVLGRFDNSDIRGCNLMVI